jgi:membrane protease subunit (stomatin/prohibitin family)
VSIFDKKDTCACGRRYVVRSDTGGKDPAGRLNYKCAECEARERQHAQREQEEIRSKVGSRYCPKCRKVLTSAFCPNCGSAPSGVVVDEVKWAAQMQRPNRRCVGCGKPSTSKFCPDCGKPVL